MLSEETLKKIQRFHFQTKRLANDLFAGQYASAFKGRGVEFAEVREYQPGDDIRTIDWNVSARFGHPFVKVFHEERQLTVMLLLDLSGSNLFGTVSKFKRELLAEVAGMLAFMAIRTNDKVGAILFSSIAERYIPPKKGVSHVWRLIKEVFTYEPKDLNTNIEGALTYLNRVVRRHAIVFLISDCVDTGFEKSLRLTAKKHDLTIIRISDPAEDELPNVGLIRLRDPESGQSVLINTGSKGINSRWRNYRKDQVAYIGNFAKKAGIDMVELSTAGAVIEPLTRFFDARRRRL
ncbi:MAG: DUF58 domain-containing protein [Deltaproteobacteria bacterium]|nr:DUF58 domain-containing protein [Deltaproteobacteria bacterium]MBW2600545.1 DUF58 domain-containing protein [Deltaproteobacteria bacterium]